MEGSKGEKVIKERTEGKLNKPEGGAGYKIHQRLADAQLKLYERNFPLNLQQECTLPFFIQRHNHTYKPVQSKLKSSLSEISAWLNQNIL